MTQQPRQRMAIEVFIAEATLAKPGHQAGRKAQRIVIVLEVRKIDISGYERVAAYSRRAPGACELDHRAQERGAVRPAVERGLRIQQQFPDRRLVRAMCPQLPVGSADAAARWRDNYNRPLSRSSTLANPAL